MAANKPTSTTRKAGAPSSAAIPNQSSWRPGPTHDVRRPLPGSHTSHRGLFSSTGPWSSTERTGPTFHLLRHRRAVLSLVPNSFASLLDTPTARRPLPKTLPLRNHRGSLPRPPRLAEHHPYPNLQSFAKSEDCGATAPSRSPHTPPLPTRPIPASNATAPAPSPTPFFKPLYSTSSAPWTIACLPDDGHGHPGLRSAPVQRASNHDATNLSRRVPRGYAQTHATTSPLAGAIGESIGWWWVSHASAGVTAPSTTGLQRSRCWIGSGPPNRLQSRPLIYNLQHSVSALRAGEGDGK